MSDFPNNFDYIVYGTGIVESIISAAFSVTGNRVLHIDRNGYYGCYGGSLRLLELMETIDKWKNDTELNENESIFLNKEVYVKNAGYTCFVPECTESNGEENDAKVELAWSKQSLNNCLRSFEFELYPRLIYCESETVDALIQSDVKRYLEFQFVSKFGSLLDDDQLILIPINRSDIVRTKVFSLRQKRQLTSFLEWCFSVSIEDELVQRYAGRPFRELMYSEKNVDEFIGKIILECLVLSSKDVETKEGLERLKRLLNSFNKIGPYPMLWPNYGAGEIPQAFCRMSAVFGAVYSLSTSIDSINCQSSQNGQSSDSFQHHEESHQPEQRQEASPDIPIEYRKLKVSLSNGCQVFADKIICHKSYIHPCRFTNIDSLHWVMRCILVTTSSLVKSDRKPNDIFLLPLYVNELTEPIVILEIPVEKRIISEQPTKDLFVVHLTAHSNVCADARVLFNDVINRLFLFYSQHRQIDNANKPTILSQFYFTLPEFCDVTTTNCDIGQHVVLVNGSIADIDFDQCFAEAKSVFNGLRPGDPFLPSPPNPEDIIQIGDEMVPTNQGQAGDFPFQSSPDDVIGSASSAPDAPGDVTVVAGIDAFTGSSNDEQTLSGLLAEMEMQDES